MASRLEATIRKATDDGRSGDAVGPGLSWSATEVKGTGVVLVSSHHSLRSAHTALRSPPWCSSAAAAFAILSRLIFSCPSCSCLCDVPVDSKHNKRENRSEGDDAQRQKWTVLVYRDANEEGRNKGIGKPARSLPALPRCWGRQPFVTQS